MNVLICRTCGCSLVRLGVSKEQAVPYNYDGKEYYFCCQGCVDLFITDSQKYMQETDDLIVCPSCLAEKPRQYAAKLVHEGREVYFCRCPYCTDLFPESPDFYIDRLEGKIPFEGVLGFEGCCVRPI